MKLNNIFSVIFVAAVLACCSDRVKDVKCYSGGQLIYSGKTTDGVSYTTDPQIFEEDQGMFFRFKDMTVFVKGIF